MEESRAGSILRQRNIAILMQGHGKPGAVEMLRASVIAGMLIITLPKKLRVCQVRTTTMMHLIFMSSFGVFVQRLFHYCY
jgi:hypothetical protein